MLVTQKISKIVKRLCFDRFSESPCPIRLNLEFTEKEIIWCLYSKPSIFGHALIGSFCYFRYRKPYSELLLKGFVYTPLLENLLSLSIVQVSIPNNMLSVYSQRE